MPAKPIFITVFIEKNKTAEFNLTQDKAKIIAFLKSGSFLTITA